MKMQASLRFRSSTSGDGCQLKTHQLDAIYMLIISYQDDFKSVSDLNEKMRSMQMNSSQSKQRIMQTQIQTSNKMLKYQSASLYKFFEAAFHLATHKNSQMSLKDNRLSDIAALWLKVLTPWNTGNQFIDAAINV